MPAQARPRSSRPTLPEDHFAVGEILRAHGTRGEVKVRSLSDNAERFLPESQVDVSRPPFRLTVQHARTHKDAWLIQFAEVTTRTQAESLRGAWLSVDAAEASALAADSYWIHDIIGCRVQTEEGRLLGRIRHILATGANDVYEVEPDANLGVSGPILLPATADVVRQVDIQRQMVTVHLLPGLIDC